LPEPKFQNTQITSAAVREARPQFVEQLEHHLAVTQARKCQPSIGQGRLFAKRNNGLGHAAKFLGLRQSCFDDLMPQQRISHVPQHGKPMAAGAVQFSQSELVTHVLSP